MRKGRFEPPRISPRDPKQCILPSQMLGNSGVTRSTSWYPAWYPPPESLSTGHFFRATAVRELLGTKDAARRLIYTHSPEFTRLQTARSGLDDAGGPLAVAERAVRQCAQP